MRPINYFHLTLENGWGGGEIVLGKLTLFEKKGTEELEIHSRQSKLKEKLVKQYF